ncbi:MAG: hypothetical protein U1E63_01670 [Burkholderiales bacterium]
MRSPLDTPCARCTASDASPLHRTPAANLTVTPSPLLGDDRVMLAAVAVEEHDRRGPQYTDAHEMVTETPRAACALRRMRRHVNARHGRLRFYGSPGS